MFQRVEFRDFVEAFERMWRTENFTYEGLRALFDFLESFEEDTGEPVELDVIGLCCDFTEYRNLEEFRRDCGDEFESLEDVEEEYFIIPVGDEGFIVQG
jgi:hypothetical protein